MPSADAPIRSLAAHASEHHHDHGHHDAPAAVLSHADAPPLTLLTSGLAYRLSTAAVLTGVLWAVVLWALQ